MTAEPGDGGPGPPPEVAASSKPRERDRWPDWLLGSGIGLRTLYGLAMLPLIPLLIGPNPLLLTLLSGSAVAEVVVGARVRLGEISWPAALLAGIPLWVLTDWLYWAAGVRWGDRALAVLTRRGKDPKAAKRAARAERLIHRFGPAGVVLAKFLPVPSPLMYAAAGVAEVRLATFLLLNLVGVALAAAAAVTLGYVVGTQAVGLVELFQQYAVSATVVLVVLLVGVQLLRRRREG